MKMQRSENPILFLSHTEKEQVTKAIQLAEFATSGEIRVHLERKIEGDPLAHAKAIFEKIGMTDTNARNGVLILLGVKSHRMVVLGDQGINDIVADNFWDDVICHMVTHFTEDRFGDGLAEGILMVGNKLKEHFPYQRNDINELPDEMSYSM
jgi:uncharacterized membrane protein